MRDNGLRTAGFRAAWLAVEAAGLTRHEKLVLITLSKYSDDAYRSFPSERRLAAVSRATVRSVRRVLRQLEARGLIAVDPRGGPKQPSGQRPNAYTIRIEVLQALPAAFGGGERADTGVPSRGGRGDKPSAGEGTNRARERGRQSPPNGPGGNGPGTGNPPTPRGGGRAGEPVFPGGAEGDDATLWLDGFNRATGLGFVPTRENLRAIRERIGEARYTAADADRVASWAAATWPGTRRGDFIRPSTVFGAKFDGYLQAARNGHARGGFDRRPNAKWDEADADA